jgi:hypothetical protein
MHLVVVALKPVRERGPVGISQEVFDFGCGGTESAPSVRLMDLADRSALTRVPLFAVDASMKQGSFAPDGLCCPAHRHYYDPSDSLSTTGHFPGSPVIGRRASRRPQRRGRGGPPQFPGQPSGRSTPPTPEGPSTPAPETQVSSMAFTVAKSARLPLDHPKVVAFDDACAGFAHAADRPLAPPCSAPGISATHEGFTTEDSGVSPDRTCTGR